MGTKNVIFVRHGQIDPDWVPTDSLEGGLSVLGRKQARAVARRLAGQPVSIIRFSTLRRAAETAAIIGRSFPGIPLFGTRNLWESIPSVPPVNAKRYASIPTETIAHEKQRVDRLFTQLFASSRGKDRCEIAVCHGNLICYLVCRVLGAPSDAWGNLDMHNCGISEVSIETNGRKVLVCHNDTAHVSPGDRTYG